MQDFQLEFVRTCYPLAKAAGDHFGINPFVALAQTAHESDWGRSYSARVRHNYTGMLAIGSPNLWWKGAKSASSVNPKLIFRIYATPADSYFDYARLVVKKYPQVAALSHDTAAFAHAMAASDYITEQNGDNRQEYGRSLAANAVAIEAAARQLHLI